jgi:hypothetical protein
VIPAPAPRRLKRQLAREDADEAQRARTSWPPVRSPSAGWWVGIFLGMAALGFSAYGTPPSWGIEPVVVPVRGFGVRVFGSVRNLQVGAGGLSGSEWEADIKVTKLLAMMCRCSSSWPG